MTTWTLWIGALLVVGGSAAQLTHHTAAARALWVLAVPAFMATTVGAVTAAEFSLPLVLILVAAIAATCALIAITREPAKANAKAKAKAAAGRGGEQ
ncbi:hypothetical protein [Rhodococcus sp. ACPA1]|uniref:hypothetical protein n=1 Tax=Rhodococcus sp. ACPA1 TaxID=2028572 RepID=UPI000BB1029C|nr:hypothetical protein [Rhodococcus sp. ACPA1]PBC47141.1 hypothetical protein CJ177_43185 [Rhodococcus sp. ACPA1]